MIKNYIKIAFRSILKQKMFSAINIFGLAVGLAGSLIIAVFVWNELSYEKIQKNGDNIYRIAIEFGNTSDGMKMAGAMPGLGPAAKEELPEVEEFVRIFTNQNAEIEINNEKYKNNMLYFADESILNVFTFNMKSQLNTSPLSEPYNILVSENLEDKYFGNGNALNKTLQYEGHTFQVSGVFKNPEGNTQINPDLITSYKTKEAMFGESNTWYSFGQDMTFLLMNKKVNEEELKEKLTAIAKNNTNENFMNMIRFIPEQFPGIYLNSTITYDIFKHGNKSYIYLFSTIAFFVLFIASLNFINLSTARSFSRAKEVGVKKVLGARRKQLVYQFLSESFIVTLMSLLLGIILMELLFPVVVGSLGIHIGITIFSSMTFYMIVLGLLMFVGLLAGLYPAFYLTSFNPIVTLRSNLGKSQKGIGFRKVLVVSQFVLSILLIFGTTVVYQQLNYLQNANLGLQKENIVLINYLPQNPEAENKYETFKTELLQSSSISNVSGVFTLPGVGSREQGNIRLAEAPEEETKLMRFNGVDYSFIKTFGIKILAGRDFNKDFATDRDGAIILNEKAAEEFGVDNIVGKQMYSINGKTPTVIGIVKNFNVESLKSDIAPLVLYINPQRYNTIAVKISDKNSNESIEYIKTKWSSIFPDQEISYSFFSDKYNSLYASEEKISQLVSIFSFLAIYIASLGLFGLVSFSVMQRKKEVGIRKVLGASVKGVVGLLSGDYIKLIIIASIISLPLAYYLMDQWLSDFAYRINIDWTVFVISVLVAVAIAGLSISFQTIKAAIANPIESLKYE